ncbi:type III polyketide synthase [Marinoscillum sp. MHG1-6]|uniref:type III polyketide synthase n=1 Tax=Marinoscillum sp. MHG1-6 TaxID=2959627 RepID=UPI0021587C29|nr:type III polyketide synthase [Marinoscillum sp. MHG1-6]
MPSYISSIGTAVPRHQISQDKILDFMLRHLPLSEEQQHELRLLYRASGIKTRHSVVADYGTDHPETYEFYPKDEGLYPIPSVDERMRFYESNALDLSVSAVNNCLDGEKIKGDKITHLITVSCTGMQAPGLDISLIPALRLRTDVIRSTVNFMGCYAAILALRQADQILKSDHKAKVLIVCVELCSIHFQQSVSEDDLLAGALFADGAAAVLVEGSTKRGKQLELLSFYSDLDLDARDEMSWKISQSGFLMRLSPEVPAAIQKGIKGLMTRLLKKISLTSEQVDYYAIHPGGKKILEVIEKEVGISKMDNFHSYEVLRAYGNMSSPTVLFVIKKLLEELEEQETSKNILSFAFGPGLTLESMMLKTHFT